MNRNLSAAAAATALLIHTMEKPEEKQAKRDLFEAIAFQEYQDRGAVGGLDIEALCARNTEDPEAYHFVDLNRAWWGFQAGYHAAALAAREKR